MLEVKLNKDQLDAVVVETIKQLESQVRNLEGKLRRRDSEITFLKNGMDVTKGTRTKIRDLSNQLVTAINDASWNDVEDVYGDD